MPAVPGAQGHRRRADHMDRRADIGIGVKLIKALQESGEDVVPFKSDRPQLLTVGKQDVEHHGRGVGQHDEFHEPLEGLHIIKKRIDVDADQEYEPEQVGDQKKLTERDQIVQGAGNGIIGFQ